MIKADTIVKIIKDREYDIPEWVYNHVTEEVLYQLMDRGNSHKDIKNYISNDKVRAFYDTLRWSIKLSEGFVRNISECGSGYSLLLFNDREFKMMQRGYKKRPVESDIFIYVICNYATLDDVFIDRAKYMLKYSYYPKSHYIHYFNSIIGNDSERCNRLLKILEVSKDYELTDLCLQLGIPVLHDDCDIVDVDRFLDCVISYKWKEDFKIPQSIISQDDDEITVKLISISRNINMNTILNLKGVFGPDGFRSVVANAMVTKTQTTKPITDFNNLISAIGENKYGIAMNIQKDFIEDGGDILSMIDGNVVKPEATILKTVEEMNFIISHLSVEGLRSLLYKSSDFVKNILSSPESLSHSSMIKIMQALCEYPINEELWNVLNGKSPDYYHDFRFRLVSYINTYINTESIYGFVPEYMMYKTPSIFYITRKIDNDNIKYIPADRIMLYVKSIINREYIPLNYFCNGEYVTLDKVVGDDIHRILTNIVSSGNFGYICDLVNGEGVM